MYGSQSYKVGKASFWALLTVIGLLVILFLSGIFFKSTTFILLGWVSIFLVPFLFQKRYKKIFTRNVSLEFNSVFFKVVELNSTSNTSTKTTTIDWSKMKNYTFSFSSNVLYLTTFNWNGSTARFSFNEEREQEQIINEKSIFSIFRYYISLYNSSRSEDKRISFKPGFFFTKSGVLTICLIGVLIITAIIINIVIKPKTSMFSMMGLFIIIGLLAKRKSEKELYEKMNLIEQQNLIPKWTED